jgi:UPF0271 protein
VASVVSRAVRISATGKVVTMDGSEITVPVDTICIHGDTSGAAELARAVRTGLERAGVSVVAISGSPR